MKILIIDPHCVDLSSSYYYIIGLAKSLAKVSDVTLVSTKYCHIEKKNGIKLKPMFYPFSEKMKRGKVRQILRGFEYIITYAYLFFYTMFNNFDVIQVEWPIIYKLDKYIFKTLKRHCKVFVLKAHNVLPHSSGQKYIKSFESIYSIPDRIVVHGKKMEQELLTLFPRVKNQIRIQKHGVYTDHDISYEKVSIDGRIQSDIEKYERKYLFYGRIDKDKGLNRLVEIWRRNFLDRDSLLIIAGKASDGFNGISEIESKIKEISNILYIPGYIEDNLLNYLIDQSNIIVLPYKDGSMSGVAFTAAEFSKPILSTQFGSIDEYIDDGITGYIVKNDDALLEEKMIEIDNEVTNEDLEKLGKNMRNYFEENYQWDSIAQKLIDEVYEW